MTNVMLTTLDNPFDPYKDFDSWLKFDHEKGYYTIETLARIDQSTDEMPENIQEKEYERACNVLLKLNPFGNYKKVYKPS